ncbi:ABC transporter ATP-binding protein [Tissierella creatinophila]|uniref:Putative ABC transporter ATP-binding protein n=1 Tax=Tissierella creatinophila DSM 6911 TaxID=1123403 RepID=A0A1U7M8H6_TISCR|nr:putative ABC transporter ATP-binding protein [Tissierella creatinophila DSM 6911]
MKEKNIKTENKPRGGGGMGGPMGGHIGAATEKPKDFKGTFKKLLTYLKPFRLKLIFVVIFAIGSTIFAILGPKILGKATTKIFEGVIEKITGVEGGGIDFEYVKNIIFILLALYASSSLFAFIQGFIVTGVAQKVSYNLRNEISEKVNKLPLKYFDKVSHGDVLSRVTNDVDTVSQSLNQSLSQIITSFTTIIGVLIMMVSISWQMTLIALLILPVSVLLVINVVKRSQKYFTRQQESLGKVNGHIEEVYGGHQIMKAFNAEGEAVGVFRNINNELYDSAWKSQFLSGLMMPIMSFVGNLGYVGVSILGGWFAIRKTIEVGDILSFIQYIRSFTQPINQVAQISNVLQSTVAASERVFEFLEEDEEILETKNPIEVKTIEGRVSFDNVKFGYDKEKIIINDFTAHVNPGQKVAIVGPTGAGKTTIVKLLMRFYELNGGSISIDGHDIKEFSREDLRSNFGMVLQDTWLFKGTIMDNIRYGRLDATDEEVINAAKAAHAHRFIQTLPEGYNMVINEEANNISQGQKQLLTIARAILSDPRLLILDEATSSVDTRTEVLIQKAMENLMQKRTSFIIAHRLSTIKNADLILVMNDGDIVEQGSHNELLAKEGFYAELYNSQFEERAVS